MQVRAPVPAGASSGGLALGDDFGWGVFIDFKRKAADGSAAVGAAKTQKGGKSGGGGGGVAGGAIQEYMIDVLVRCAPGAEEAIQRGDAATPSIRDADGGSNGEEAFILTLPFAHADRFSSVRIKLPHDLRSSDARHTMAKVLREVEARFPGGPPLLSPTDEMKVRNESVPKLLRKIETAQVKCLGLRTVAAPLTPLSAFTPNIGRGRRHVSQSRDWQTLHCTACCRPCGCGMRSQARSGLHASRSRRWRRCS